MSFSCDRNTQVIALGLELKFGEAALELMPEVDRIKNVERLTEVKDALKTLHSLE